jgi:alpha-tubulin suppressor-like RCC1 family protein
MAAEYGLIYSWGSNWYGELGIDNNEIRSSPTVLTQSLQSVSAGGDFSLAQQLEGGNFIASWGSNLHGQLAQGVPGWRSTPNPVTLP